MRDITNLYHSIYTSYYYICVAIHCVKEVVCFLGRTIYFFFIFLFFSSLCFSLLIFFLFCGKDRYNFYNYLQILTIYMLRKHLELLVLPEARRWTQGNPHSLACDSLIFGRECLLMCVFSGRSSRSRGWKIPSSSSLLSLLLQALHKLLS